MYKNVYKVYVLMGKYGNNLMIIYRGLNNIWERGRKRERKRNVYYGFFIIEFYNLFIWL